MSTVKITDLPVISHLNADTANTIFVGVDLPTNVTGRISATVLADGLYENKSLKVGLPDIIFPNVIAQFSGSGDPYLQINAQNIDANNSIDYVATADIGTTANNFIDMGMNNSLYDDPDFSAQKALDGYLYVHGSVDSSSDGNLIIGTASAGANVVFAVGGQRTANVVAKITKFGITLNNASRLEFTDGSIQTVAAAPASSTQGAFNTANSASSNTVIIQGVNVTQNNNIIAVNQYAASGYAKANAALANTTGTFAGDLTVTGNTFAQAMNTANFSVVGTANVSGTMNVVGDLTVLGNTYSQKVNTANFQVNGTANISGTMNVVGVISGNAQVVLQNTQFSAAQAALTISASPSVALPSNDGYMIHISGKNGIPSRIVTDSYGTNSYVVYAGRAARGNIDNPSALQANDVISRISSNGYGTTKYQPLGVGRIDFIAAENFTDANTGSRIQFWNCPVGSNTLTNIATFNGDSVDFTGAVKPEKGFVYIPRILFGAQTAITVDFATDSIIKASLTADLTLSFANYTYGKVVEVWLTNTGGTARTVTHGCSATNSSDNSTTFTIPSTSSAYLKYFSIDGDLANTYVTSIHA